MAGRLGGEREPESILRKGPGDSEEAVTVRDICVLAWLDTGYLQVSPPLTCGLPASDGNSSVFLG